MWSIYEVQDSYAVYFIPLIMSGRPRTTSFAEGSKSVRRTFENQPPKPPLGGVKISSKYFPPNHSLVGHRDFLCLWRTLILTILKMAANCHKLTNLAVNYYIHLVNKSIRWHLLSAAFGKWLATARGLPAT